jgi:hypothetical protein
VDRTLHPIPHTIIPDRGYLVLIGRRRLQTHHAHTENRFRMTLVEPDMIFRRLAQIIGIGPIVYDGVIVVVAPGLLVAHLMIARSSWAISSAGPLRISTCAAFGPGGGF